MRKPALWVGLFLSSVVVTGTLVTGTTGKTSATPDRAIAQTTSSASVQDNVGGPLAQQLQGKPVVVDIYATWCPACGNIAPTLSQLRQEYGDRIHFIKLDVSDRSHTSESELRANELGLASFFAENKSNTGIVTIIDPDTGNILGQYYNNPEKSAYTRVIDSALNPQ
jgi:thiol-disulfide isomerase/thioredoxin